MKNIGIIGAGNLGKHLASLLCKNRLEHFTFVSDKDSKKSEEIADNYDLSFGNNRENIQHSDILLLTVKPNEMKDVCEEINKYCDNEHQYGKILLSAAAGVPTDKIETWTNKKHKIVRIMPNLPISLGSGSIVWHTKEHDVDKIFLSYILEGPANIWVNDEFLIDAATVVSGCGPAFLSKIFEEVYVDVSVNFGFTSDEARKLAKHLFLGTSMMLQHESGHEIIKQVASKGGVTEKALDILNKHYISIMMKQTMLKSVRNIQKITETLD